ncbi:MAG: RNA polymerase sigma factor [Pseudomonadota bacterium]
MMAQPDHDFCEGLVDALPHLRRFAFVLTDSTSDADDLLQATCERALARSAQFRKGTRQLSWLFSIMDSISKNQRRADATRKRVHSDMANVTPLFDGERDTLGKIHARDVLSLMKTLDRDQAAALTLVAIEGYSYRDAAEALGVPQGTLESRVARGRVALGQAIEQGAPTGPDTDATAERRGNTGRRTAR